MIRYLEAVFRELERRVAFGRGTVREAAAAGVP